MVRALIALVAGAVLGLAGLAGYGYVMFKEPVVMPNGEIVFRVQPGWSGAKIAHELESAGVIKDAFGFRVASKILSAENHFRAGKYRFKGSLSAEDIQKILLEGQVLTTQFVIAEGLNKWQIADKLASAFPSFSAGDFLAAFRDPSLLANLPSKATDAEGYLFPETYTVNEDATPGEIARIMVMECKKRLTPEVLLLARDRGLDEHQLVTLASIIEKETGAPSERGVISSVFHNRLGLGMKLQTDPTVIYGMWERYDGNIRKKDLQTPTPYNTYTIFGLPPGPIASPGQDAIEKAASPETTDYIFFVARGDGTGLHDFSRTLAEHNRAVARYLRHYRQGLAK